MKLFGIISILIVVALGAVISVSQMGLFSQSGKTDTNTYQDAIESAEDAAEKITESTGGISQKTITIYDGFSFSEKTTGVDLSGNGLTGSLKAEIRHLTELRELNLSNNKFTGLPAEVGQLTKLQVLNLSNNPFTGLPSELGNLKNLKVLDLRGTNYAPQDLKSIQANLPESTQVLVD